MRGHLSPERHRETTPRRWEIERTVKLGVDWLADVHLGRLRGYEADEASPLLLSAVNYALAAVFCGELTVLIGDMVVGRRRARQTLRSA